MIRYILFVKASQLDLFGSRQPGEVRTHQRKYKSGKVVTVREHRTGKPLPHTDVAPSASLVRSPLPDHDSPLPKFPETILEFTNAFPDDRACADYLENVKWPQGFVCPHCAEHGEPYRFANRPSILRCRACQKDTSVTAGTVMHGTKTPLRTWFWGAHFVTTQTPGFSAVQFQRQLNIPRYETAFQILHKLRAGMVRPDADKIGGDWRVEVDETYVGGRTRGEGRGVHHGVLVACAVETRPVGKDRKHHKVQAGRIRLAILPDRTAESCRTFVESTVEPGSSVATDGWHGYNDLTKKGYKHEAVVVSGAPEANDAHLPMVHIVFSNLKSWLTGTHHGVSPKHLQAYLNEFTFRFNRRFYPMASFNSVLGIGTRTTGPTYRDLYEGEWDHPNPMAGAAAAAPA